jgi:hypothetical protein
MLFAAFASYQQALYAGILAAIGIAVLAGTLVLAALVWFTEPVIAPEPVFNPIDPGEAPEMTAEIPALSGEPEVQAQSAQATGRRYQPRHAAGASS